MPTHLPPDWHLASYDFPFPQELVAQYPASPRDHARMMVLSRHADTMQHRHFYEIPQYLPAHAILVVNNTKVVPARLLGHRASGGQIEALLIKEHRPGVWEALLKRAKRIKPRETLWFGEEHLVAQALERVSQGHWLLAFAEPSTLVQRLEQYGWMPLPPYIQRKNGDRTQDAQDRQAYQTCFAAQAGAIAAPTAGLHFTPAVLAQIRAQGVAVVEVTLYVALGTFAPVLATDIRQHPIHEETFSLSEQSRITLLQGLERKQPIVAVGTTVVRVLETLAQNQFSVTSGTTGIYLYPPYEFKVVSGLLTNFHRPQSTLLMLVSALYGRERLLQAYQTAIEQRYRLFSYGDCMLILF